MKLLHFAHRGEAQEFIKNLKLVADSEFSGLYVSNEVVLFIAGEGIYETMGQQSYLLAKFPIKEIINFGIAGALEQKLTLNEIYSVRTVYAFDELAPKFHSFTSADTKASWDCISASKRVLSDDYANSLSHFAPIVDRELWAVGFVANKFKIPFYSYKLISDYAGATTQCFDIKHKALEFSEQLFEYFLSLVDDQEKRPDTFLVPMPMSFTQKMKFQKLMQALVQRDHINESEIYHQIDLDKIQSLAVKPKVRANILLEQLEMLLNPLKKQIDEKIQKFFSPFEMIGAQVKLDPKLETKKFTLSMEINSESNIKNLSRALDQFQFSRLEKIWNGELDV